MKYSSLRFSQLNLFLFLRLIKKRPKHDNLRALSASSIAVCHVAGFIDKFYWWTKFNSARHKLYLALLQHGSIWQYALQITVFISGMAK